MNKLGVSLVSKITKHFYNNTRKIFAWRITYTINIHDKKSEIIIYFYTLKLLFTTDNQYIGRYFVNNIIQGMIV